MSWSSRRPGDDNIGPAAVANSSSANNTIVSPADEGYPPTSSRQLQNDEYVDEHDEFMFNNPLTAWTHMTRTLAHYDILEKIGEGTYGFVYRARCRDTNKFVALKKVRLSHAGLSGIPQQLVREIKILKRLRHVNLLRMIEVVTSKGVEYLEDTQPDNQSNNSNINNNVQTMLTGSSTGNNKNENTKREKSTKTPELDKVQEARERYKGNLYIVLEYVEHDLVGLMDVAYQFTPVQVKCIFRQLLQGLAHMHEQKYIHRDIKSSNILLDSHFRLKLADFGLARSTEPPLLDRIRQSSVTVNGIPTQDFTNKVITLWYRPPEILVGATQYGPAVDIWSAGCILVELMMSGKPLFTGKTELEQLTLIWDMLGSPSASTWEYLSNMKKAKAGEVTIDISHHRSGRLRDKYTNKIPNVALNFLEKLLEWDPRKRLTATRALENRYFWTQPVAPDDPAELGTIQVGPGGHFHEFQTKKQRKQAKAIADQAKEKARHKGKSEEEVQAVFDKTYRSLMKKVAQEGLGVVTELQPIASEVHDKSQISMTAVAVAPLPQDQPTADLDKAPVEQFPTGDVDLDRRDRRNVDEPYDDRRHRRRRRREEGDDEDGEDRSRRRRHRGSRDRHDNEASYRARRREEKASSGRHRRSRDREGVDRRRDRTRDGAGHVKGLDGDDDRTFSHASLDLSFGETNGDTTMSEAVKSSNESVRNDQAAASPQQDRLSEEHESKTGTSNTSRWGERKSREKVVGNEVERVDESKQPEEKPNSKSQDVSGRVDDVPVESAKSDRSGVIEGGSHGRHNDRDPSRDERLDHGRNEDRRRNEREEGSLGRDDYKHRDREEPPHFRDDRRFGDRGGRGDYNDLSRRRDDNPDDRHMRHDGERRRGHHGRLRHHRHHHRSGRRSNV